MRQLDAVNWDTPGLIDRMKELFNDGLSFADVSFKINQEFKIGSTRNAVIGISRRRKLKAGVTAPKLRPGRKLNPGPRVRIKRVYKSPAPPQLKRTLEMISRQEAVEQPSKSIAIWESGCKWPDDMTAQPLTPICETFCGHGVEEGKSYCSFHAKMVYAPNSRGPKQKFSQSRGRAMYYLSPSTTR